MPTTARPSKKMMKHRLYTLLNERISLIFVCAFIIIFLPYSGVVDLYSLQKLARSMLTCLQNCKSSAYLRSKIYLNSAPESTKRNIWRIMCTIARA